MPREKQPDTPPELSPAEVQDRVWREPGGDALAVRATKIGTNADGDDQSDAVAKETPSENLRRISDPHIDTSKKRAKKRAGEKS